MPNIVLSPIGILTHVILTTFYRWRNWGTGRLSNWPTSQLGPGIRTQGAWHQRLCVSSLCCNKQQKVPNESGTGEGQSTHRSRGGVSGALWGVSDIWAGSWRMAFSVHLPACYQTDTVNPNLSHKCLRRSQVLPLVVLIILRDDPPEHSFAVLSPPLESEVDWKGTGDFRIGNALRLAEPCYPVLLTLESHYHIRPPPATLPQLQSQGLP